MRYSFLFSLASFESPAWPRELCDKAGVDPSAINYWEDLLEAVKQCKAAGIIPMAGGGFEKWPLQFYPALLMMRILGKDGMASAYKGDFGGFAGSEVVKACSTKLLLWR